METCMGLLKLLKVDLPYNPAGPRLDIYSPKMKTLIWKDIGTAMLIAVLFTKAKIGKKQNCPLMDEWIYKM